MTDDVKTKVDGVIYLFPIPRAIDFHCRIILKCLLTFFSSQSKDHQQFHTRIVFFKTLNETFYELSLRQLRQKWIKKKSQGYFSRFIHAFEGIQLMTYFSSAI